ncbi:uroporphyrinogen decarboxylase family protein [Bengtsoniella intestinalis]|uniref:uroporphyrinogen decarboxylase family protein n=1 Tax=Bengtsoniella intestinalis TaxID=3073143 RepID=UPI00391EF1AA
MNIEPNYQRMVDVALNKETDYIPLYDHIVDDSIMDAIMGTTVAGWNFGTLEQCDEYFRVYCDFYKQMGYDTVSYAGKIIEILPNGGSLENPIKQGVIQEQADFDAYPWDTIEELYFTKYDPIFTALARHMPEGMKAIGGVGNGVFEMVQDLVGYQDLCYLSVDEPELYAALFQKCGEIWFTLWTRFLKQDYADAYCIPRTAEDWGFNANTLISADDIREHLIPHYVKLSKLVHETGKPFLFHNCGKIFSVMGDLIDTVGIDAKHSNEDSIAPFSHWVKEYGDKIAFLGGIDMDVLCRMPPQEMDGYIRNMVEGCRKDGRFSGIALGAGNSIPDYVPVEQYLAMNKILRTLRVELRS